MLETRAELIARFRAASFAPPAPPPPAPAPPAKSPTDEKAPPDSATSDPDKTVTEAIATARAAISAAQVAQKKDAGNAADPNDAKVSKALDDTMAALEAADAAQVADVAGDAKGADEPPAKGAGPAADAAGGDASDTDTTGSMGAHAIANTDPKVSPVDSQGNVDPKTVCATDGCGHLASAHMDTENGQNTGACSMANCSCGEMSFASNNGAPGTPQGDDANADGGAGQPDGGGVDNAGGADMATVLSSPFRAASGLWVDGFDMSDADRQKAADSGAAMPDGSYPITTCDGDNSVATAVNAVGRGSADHDAIRRHIMKRAESLGCSSKIPDNWNADGSLEAEGSSSADSSGRFADAGDDMGDDAAAGSGDEPGEPTFAGPDANPAPPVEASATVGAPFTMVAIIEGQQTIDGRQIALDALEWDAPPFALMGLKTSTHDPGGYSPNDPAVLIGLVSGWSRQGGEPGTQLIIGKGNFLTTDEGVEFAAILEQFGRLPVSGDVAVLESNIDVNEVDGWGFPTDAQETLTKGKLMAATVLPFGPAFPGCYIVLGEDLATPAIPQATEPAPGLTAAAQIVNFVALEACEPCEGDLAVVASAAPVSPPRAWFENPNFAEGDGRLVPMIGEGEYGRMVRGFTCPPTVTDEGRVYGYIAPWGVCHIGQRGPCVTAPHSVDDYVHFKRGQHVITAEGDSVRVGVLTFDTGHAPGHASSSDAMAHYDNTALAFADVNVGEDEHGIWYAGALRPGLTDEQVRKFRAASISGDWRKIGGHLELVSAQLVNTPGFPAAVVADGSVVSLVAAGSLAIAATREAAPEAEPYPEYRDEALRRALAPTLEARKAELRAQRREALEAKKAEIRARVAELRA